jgi:tetratricopeptide (TPR) repeat protein
MDVHELLRVAARRLPAGDPDTVIDAAVRAYPLADDAPTRGRAALLAGLGARRKGAAADAILWCDKALEVVPDDREALACRGWAHTTLGRLDDAMADLDAAVEGDTAVPAAAHVHRAAALRALGRAGEAYAELDRVVDDHREGARALRLRGSLRLDDGDPVRAGTDFAEAARRGDQDALEDLLRLHDLPDDPAIWLTQVRALAGAEDGPADVEARLLLDRLLARGDLDPAVRAAALAERASMVDTPAEAADLLAQAVDLAPDDAALLTDLGRALFEADRDDEAATVLRRAAALAPGDGRPEWFLGDLYAYAEDWPVADDWYARAMRLRPRCGAVLFGRSQALLRLDAEKEACDLAVRAAIAGDGAAARWCRDNELPTPDLVFDTAGWLLRSMGNPTAAEQHYRTAADIWLSHSGGPGDFCARHAAAALTNAARCRLDLGDPLGAEQLCRRALGQRPGLRDAWTVLGDALTRSGRLPEALAAYDRGAWCDPTDAGAQAGRAEALRRLGRAVEAMAALDRAVELGPNVDLHHARARLHQALGHWDLALTDVRYLLADGGWNPWEWRDWVDGLRTIAHLTAGPSFTGPPPAYRRYGLTRGSRRTGAWAYRLRLREAPDPATRVRIARAAAGVIDPDRFGDSPPWLWSGAFVLVRLNPGEDTDAAATLDTLARVVDAVHGVAPVVEAVGFEARGVDAADPAEAWSVRTRPVPDPGPEFGVPSAFWVPGVGDTTAFPVPAPDPEAEAVLRTGAADALRRRAEERAADSAAALAAGEIVLVPVAEEFGDPDPQPDGVSLSPDGRRALFTSDVGYDLWCLDVDTGRTWEVLTGLPRVTSLEFLDGDQVMVKTDPWLGVYGFDGDRLVRLAARETEAGPATAWGGGRVLLAGAADVPGIVVFGWCDGVLARLAELSAPVNGDRVRVVGDRAFAADRITFELANLGPAWDRFAGWVRHRAAATAEAGGVVVEEVADAPSHGIRSAPDAVRTAANWYATGPAGLSFALSCTGAGYLALAGDADGVRPFEPALVAQTFPYDWRPDGRALLVYAQGRLVEADLVTCAVRPLLTGVDGFSYTAEGCAVVRDRTLVLYRWAHGCDGPPEEVGAVGLPNGGKVHYLGWAANGRVLHVTAGGYTSFLAVADGRLYPVGAFPARDWFHVWARGCALYFQNTDESSGVPLRLLRATGLERAVPAALATDPVRRLVPADLPPVSLLRSEYPGLTRWRFDGAEPARVHDDDDLDEDPDDF